MDLVLDRRLSISLEQLGYGPFFERQRASLDELVEPARVAAAARGVLQVVTASGPRRVTVSAGSSTRPRGGDALPPSADWVGLRPGTEVAVHRFARRTCLLRKAVGRRTRGPGAGGQRRHRHGRHLAHADFNPRRWSATSSSRSWAGRGRSSSSTRSISATIPRASWRRRARWRPTAPVIPVSALAGAGLEALRAQIPKGRRWRWWDRRGWVNPPWRTASSARTRWPRARSGSTTTGVATHHAPRALRLPGGGLLVDTPGLRELEPWGLDDGGPRASPTWRRWPRGGRFRDCGHDGEPGCAVAEALADGRLAEGRFAGFRKLLAEGRATPPGAARRPRPGGDQAALPGAGAGDPAQPQALRCRGPRDPAARSPPPPTHVRALRPRPPRPRRPDPAPCPSRRGTRNLSRSCSAGASTRRRCLRPPPPAAERAAIRSSCLRRRFSIHHSIPSSCSFQSSSVAVSATRAWMASPIPQASPGRNQIHQGLKERSTRPSTSSAPLTMT